MSDEDHKTLKDVALGLIIGACLAVVAIRCIEVHTRPDTAEADVYTARWMVARTGQAYRAPPCELYDAVF